MNLISRAWKRFEDWMYEADGQIRPKGKKNEQHLTLLVSCAETNAFDWCASDGDIGFRVDCHNVESLTFYKNEEYDRLTPFEQAKVLVNAGIDLTVVDAKQITKVWTGRVDKVWRGDRTLVLCGSAIDFQQGPLAV